MPKELVIYQELKVFFDRVKLVFGFDLEKIDHETVSFFPPKLQRDRPSWSIGIDMDAVRSACVLQIVATIHRYRICAKNTCHDLLLVVGICTETTAISQKRK